MAAVLIAKPNPLAAWFEEAFPGLIVMSMSSTSSNTVSGWPLAVKLEARPGSGPVGSNVLTYMLRGSGVLTYMLRGSEPGSGAVAVVRYGVIGATAYRFRVALTEIVQTAGGFYAGSTLATPSTEASFELYISPLEGQSTPVYDEFMTDLYNARIQSCKTKESAVMAAQQAARNSESFLRDTYRARGWQVELPAEATWYNKEKHRWMQATALTDDFAPGSYFLEIRTLEDERGVLLQDNSPDEVREFVGPGAEQELRSVMAGMEVNWESI